MTVIVCLMLWLACIGLACWADLSAQKHIQKGWDEAQKHIQKGWDEAWK